MRKWNGKWMQYFSKELWSTVWVKYFFMSSTTFLWPLHVLLLPLGVCCVHVARSGHGGQMTTPAWPLWSASAPRPVWLLSHDPRLPSFLGHNGVLIRATHAHTQPQNRHTVKRNLFSHITHSFVPGTTRRLINIGHLFIIHLMHLLWIWRPPNPIWFQPSQRTTTKRNFYFMLRTPHRPRGGSVVSAVALCPRGH